jgi:hypothetical protein
MNARKLVSIAWLVVATILLAQVGIKFVDDIVLDSSCAHSSGCTGSFAIYFAIIAVEYWCAYAVRSIRPWTGYALMAVSGPLGLWWLVDFVGNPDRSFVNVYLFIVPQFATALLTILVTASHRR